MSKPVWDSIQRSGKNLFSDDKQIRVRYIAIVEYSDITSIPDFLSPSQEESFRKYMQNRAIFTVVQLKQISTDHYSFN